MNILKIVTDGVEMIKEQQDIIHFWIPQVLKTCGNVIEIIVKHLSYM